jgi:hypothetical protein
MDAEQQTITLQNGPHEWKETWTKTGYYCPACGVQKVWVGGGDDYYVGQDHLCLACGANFYMPDGIRLTASPWERETGPFHQRLAALHAE